MEIPKTLWLKNHMPADRFQKCMFFESVSSQHTPESCSDSRSLTDYLTYRASDSLARSTCSLACKCSFVPLGAKMVHESDGGKEEISTTGWQATFFNSIGKLQPSFGTSSSDQSY